ncbi:MAG TPA: hypothetical protein VGF23_10885 [Gaiellaceae bacterium]
MRRALVLLSVLGALAAVVLGMRDTWPNLRDVRGHATAAEAARAPAVHEDLPIALFDRWKARLRPGDRWWLDIPAGEAEGLTNRGAVYRAFALYWFLPALPARSERDADVVFRLGRAR